MCGIAGFVQFQGLAQESSSLVHKMIENISYRGPDSGGVFTLGKATFGHRRLSILDLSTEGHQPMLDPTSQYMISYNGEVYNFQDLRVELTGLGHSFKSNTDTEVILRSYIEWGPSCVSKMNGMFAIAIWSDSKNELFLARDPVGIKPLFYSKNAIKIIFASEVKSILVHREVSREPDIQALDAYFTFNYTAAPRTGFKEIKQVMPGEWILLKEGSFAKKNFKYNVTANWSPKHFKSESATIEIFNDQLNQAVQRQLVSDVPVGAFLSGGLDSSAICASLSQLGAKTECFHMGFDQAEYDESRYAQQLAEHLKLKLHTLKTTVDAGSLVNISRHLLEPTADASAIPTYYLCKETSRHVKVVLSGDGADELLAGYSTYQASQLAALFKVQPNQLVLSALRKVLPWQVSLNQRYGWRDFFDRFSRHASNTFPLDHASWRNIFNKDIKTQLYKKDFYQSVSSLDESAEEQYANCGKNELLSRLQNMLEMDINFYLPNDMLVKVDRMSMAHGLEVRVPFLDLEFMNFCRNLPDKYKLRLLTNKKYILKKFLAGKVPQATLEKPKTGFNFPLEESLKGSWKDLFRDLLSDTQVQSESLLDKSSVEKIYDDFCKKNYNYKYQIFGVLMYYLWIKNTKSI